MKAAKGKKAVAAPAAGALGRAMPESLASRRAAPAKLGFAVRYRILVRAGWPGVRAGYARQQFHIGDEVAVVIEKNSAARR